MVKGNLRMKIKSVFDRRNKVVLPFMSHCFPALFPGFVSEGGYILGGGANIKEAVELYIEADD